MDHPFLVIAALIALSLIYVLGPVAMDAFARYRKTRRVLCPEETTSAEIKIDSQRASLTTVAGMERLRIRQCSLWPEKSGCGQSCLLHATPT
jgi:hypothetical protein